MEDKSVKKVNADNHNIPINIFSAPTNLGSDIYNFKSASSSPTIHFTTYLSYNTILQNQYEKQYHYQNEQRQLQLEQQQKQQLYNTGSRDYYNYGKTAISNFDGVSNKPTSTMSSATSPQPSSPPSPPLPSTPLPFNPPILNVPGDIYVEATSSAGAYVKYVVSAKAALPAPGSSGSAASGRDVQQQEVTLSPQCSPPSGSLFSIGTTTVTCTVNGGYSAGSNGGADSKTFKIVVRDTTAPALTLPADNLVIKATDNTRTAVSYYTYVSASDTVDGPVAPVCSPPSGSLFPIGTTTVSCSAIDRQGNVAAGSFVVTLRYPVFGGFLEPIDPAGNSVFKLGSTIPIRFQLKWPDGQPVIDAKIQIYNAKISDRIISTGLDESGSVAGRESVNNVPPPPTTTAPNPTNVLPPSSGNYFTYDSASGLYAFNLGTENLSPGTWQIKIVLDDGSTHTVNVSLVG